MDVNHIIAIISAVISGVGAIGGLIITLIKYIATWIKKIVAEISKIKKELKPRLTKIDATHHLLKENGVQIICKHEQMCYNKKDGKRK